MKDTYRFFKRDISWLSFNYRVLMEADDKSLPLYERINFIAIYTSNLEEFYKVRVADLKAVASGGTDDDLTAREASAMIDQITAEVNRQMEDRIRIYDYGIVPELAFNGIIFYQDENVEPFQREYIQRHFDEELYPFLQPVPLCKDEVRAFLRDNRLYVAFKLFRKDDHRKSGQPRYFMVEIPCDKKSRFIELPDHDGKHYIMYMEDVIRSCAGNMFPGYTIDCAYCFKISRDADILIDDETTGGIVEKVKHKLKKRKIGAVCRFVYDRHMPADMLEHLIYTFDIKREELVLGDRHINLEDLSGLPNPGLPDASSRKPKPFMPSVFEKQGSVFRYLSRKDFLMFCPYHSFDIFLNFLTEAAHDEATKEIFITQYRVAENSSVINSLISAARNGKKVTVFVELKARFDEANNLNTAEQMQKAGINIMYSIPGLKVHAKVALVLREDKDGKAKSFAYVGTGNFNERTACVYSDIGLFTKNKYIVDDLRSLFDYLKVKGYMGHFHRLLVPKVNLIEQLKKMIDNEIDIARRGGEGYMILKMNAIQDEAMISELYRASEAGVKIDLIVRGICCLVPGREFSRNITVTRIVDSFLEHSRVWYFENGGKPKVYIGSPDWMKRNLYKRVEAVVPVMSDELKKDIIHMLHIQLADNVKACRIDEHLNNIFKYPHNGEKRVRAQYDFYDYLKSKSME